MSHDLAETVAGVVREVRDGRGALLLDLDGIIIQQAMLAAGPDLEAVAGEYAGLLRAARGLAGAMGWGAARSYSVRGREGILAFGFAPSDLVLGVAAGPGGLSGQMRSGVLRGAAQLDLL